MEHYRKQKPLEKQSAFAVEELESLVEELMKKEPCEKSIRDYMGRFGLQYSQDPIERLNTVLKALHVSRDS